MPKITLPINQDGEAKQIQVWRHTSSALDEGDEIAEWLSDFLGIDCRLVKMSDTDIRPVNPMYAHSKNDQVSFADGYPILLLSEASLDDLNSRLETPLPMNRFRPNIVVTNTEPYAEDTWKTIRIGDVTLDIVKPCARCAITTTNQVTASEAKNPSKHSAPIANTNSESSSDKTSSIAIKDKSTLGIPLKSWHKWSFVG